MLSDWTDTCYNYIKKKEKKPHIDVLGKNKVEEGEKGRKEEKEEGGSKKKKRGGGGGGRRGTRRTMENRKRKIFYIFLYYL